MKVFRGNKRNLNWILKGKKNLDKQRKEGRIFQMKECIKVEKSKMYSVDPEFINYQVVIKDIILMIVIK